MSYVYILARADVGVEPTYRQGFTLTIVYKLL